MFNRRDVILCLCEALAMFPPTPPRPIGNLPPPSPFPFLDARHSRVVFFIFRGLVSTRVSSLKNSVSNLRARRSRQPFLLPWRRRPSRTDLTTCGPLRPSLAGGAVFDSQTEMCVLERQGGGEGKYKDTRGKRETRLKHVTFGESIHVSIVRPPPPHHSSTTHGAATTAPHVPL